MPKFIKNIIRNFFDIYAYADDSQFLSFANQFKDHSPILDPVTGKKKISAAKIFKRIFLIFILALVIFILVRIIMYNGKWM